METQEWKSESTETWEHFVTHKTPPKFKVQITINGGQVILTGGHRGVVDPQTGDTSVTASFKLLQSDTTFDDGTNEHMSWYLKALAFYINASAPKEQ
jgi:hypothetical protein